MNAPPSRCAPVPLPHSAPRLYSFLGPRLLHGLATRRPLYLPPPYTLGIIHSTQVAESLTLLGGWAEDYHANEEQALRDALSCSTIFSRLDAADQAQLAHDTALAIRASLKSTRRPKLPAAPPDAPAHPATVPIAVALPFDSAAASALPTADAIPVNVFAPAGFSPGHRFTFVMPSGPFQPPPLPPHPASAPDTASAYLARLEGMETQHRVKTQQLEEDLAKQRELSGEHEAMLAQLELESAQHRTLACDLQDDLKWYEEALGNSKDELASLLRDSLQARNVLSLWETQRKLAQEKEARRRGQEQLEEQLRVATSRVDSLVRARAVQLHEQRHASIEVGQELIDEGTVLREGLATKRSARELLAGACDERTPPLQSLSGASTSSQSTSRRSCSAQVVATCSGRSLFWQQCSTGQWCSASLAQEHRGHSRLLQSRRRCSRTHARCSRSFRTEASMMTLINLDTATTTVAHVTRMRSSPSRRS